MQGTLSCPFFRKAFGWSVPIGALVGLIGLGGGEFRLPVLMHGIGFGAKMAVPVNLLVSLITLAFAMVTRSWAVSFTSIVPHLPEVIGLTLGGVGSAFCGARLVSVLSAKRLVHLIACLLAVLGGLLLVEVISPFQHAELLPPGSAFHLTVGAAIGTGVGLVSGVLGVAGGELLIPALIFVFGADIKTAGSASILISLAVVLTGLLHYWQMKVVPHGGGVQRITLAMGAGSIIGVAIGGAAIAYAPVAFLKLLLGGVLIAAAAKTIAGDRQERGASDRR